MPQGFGVILATKQYMYMYILTCLVAITTKKHPKCCQKQYVLWKDGDVLYIFLQAVEQGPVHLQHQVISCYNTLFSFRSKICIFFIVFSLLNSQVFPLCKFRENDVFCTIWMFVDGQIALYWKEWPLEYVNIYKYDVWAVITLPNCFHWRVKNRQSSPHPFFGSAHFLLRTLYYLLIHSQ